MSREKDKRIAKLKGWYFWKILPGEYYRDGKSREIFTQHPDDPIGREIKQLEDFPHWSTNRNDALELWDEFPTENGYHKYHWQMYEKHVIVIAYNGSDVIRKEGTSFADAVSKTWEQWKGGK